MIDLVFNDLSLRPPAATRHETLTRMQDFVELISRSTEHGFGRALRIPENFYSLDLETEYRISNWLDDDTVSRDAQSLILQIATLSPFLVGSNEELEKAKQLEIVIENKRSEALEAAYLLDVPTVSLCHSNWDTPHFFCTCFNLQPNGEICSDSHRILNLARISHLTDHSEYISEKIRRFYRDGKTLWEKRKYLFGKLEFCPGVKKQLLHLNHSDVNFSQIVNHLFDLQRYAENWKNGSFNRSGFQSKCNPSSVKTLEDYRDSYSFKTDDNLPFLCHWHLYLPVNAWRIYFSPVGPNHSIVIGHIGPHLPTTTVFS